MELTDRCGTGGRHMSLPGLVMKCGSSVSGLFRVCLTDFGVRDEGYRGGPCSLPVRHASAICSVSESSRGSRQTTFIL